jgi:hypothetical protein
VAIANIQVVDQATNHYRLKFAPTALYEGGNFTVTIKNGIRDISVNQNKFVEKTFTIAVPDTKKPSVANSGNIGQNASGDKLYVYYSEEMGASAVDVNNYRLSNGTSQYALPANTTITQTVSTVTISLPKTLTALQADFGSATPINKLFIGAVTDKAGNQLAQMMEYPLVDATTTFAPGITKGKLLSDTQVSFVVDKQLKAIDAAKISVNGTATTAGTNKATSATFVNNTDGTATVTVTFKAKELSSGGTEVVTVPSKIDNNITIAAGALTDLFDLTNDADGSSGTNDNTLVTVFADYAAPQIKSITTKDTGTANGKIDTIEVVFTEDLYPASVQESDFTVEGYTVTGIQVTGSALTTDLVKISVRERTVDTGEKPKVTMVGEVEDAVTVTPDQPTRNKLTGPATVATIDGVKPVVLSVALVNKSGGTAGTAEAGDQIVITYSEAVTITGLTAGAAPIASTTALGDLTTAGTVAGFGSFATIGDLVTATGTNTVALSADSTVVTITLGAPTTNTTLPSGVFTPVAGANDKASTPNALDLTVTPTATGMF